MHSFNYCVPSAEYACIRVFQNLGRCKAMCLEYSVEKVNVATVTLSRFFFAFAKSNYFCWR